MTAVDKALAFAELQGSIIAFPDSISNYLFQAILEQHIAIGIAHVLEAHDSQNDS